jgi:prephenate dehydrogenase
MTQKKYLIIGCGLIGGSIARKLRVIDQDCIIDYFDKNEIKVERLGKYIRSNYSYDVAFTTYNSITIKTKLMVNLSSFAEPLNIARTMQIPQIGVHFMAGSEKSGFENSSATLFDGCNFSVIQYESDEKHKEILSEIEPLIKQIANANEPILSVSPEEHNVNVAYTSHLLHFLALKVPPFNKLPCLQRISQSNKTMWEAIFKKNETNIMEALGRFINIYGMYSCPADFATVIRSLNGDIPKNFKGTAYYEVAGNLDKN